MPPSVDTPETPIVDDIFDGVPDADTPAQPEINGSGQSETNGDSMAVAIQKAPKSN